MRWDAILLILYALVLIFIIVEFSSIWSLSIVLLLMLVTMLLQKIYADKEFEKSREKRDDIKNIILNRLDVFLSVLDGIRKSVEKNVVYTEKRIAEIRDINKNEIDEKCDELAKKIIDVENKMHLIKRNIDSAHESIGNRVEVIERVLNISRD